MEGWFLVHLQSHELFFIADVNFLSLPTFTLSFYSLTFFFLLEEGKDGKTYTGSFLLLTLLHIFLDVNNPPLHLHRQSLFIVIQNFHSIISSDRRQANQGHKKKEKKRKIEGKKEKPDPFSFFVLLSAEADTKPTKNELRIEGNSEKLPLHKRKERIRGQ